jgi:hypothetical protein
VSEEHECRSNLVVFMVAWALGTAVVSPFLWVWQKMQRRMR